MAASREGKLGKRTNLSSTTVSNQHKLKGGGSLRGRCLGHVGQRRYDMVCGVSDVKYEYGTASTEASQRFQMGVELGN